MPTINSLLNNLRKSPYTSTLMKILGKKYHHEGLGANTPIPNQAFLPMKNERHEPTTLIFGEQAKRELAEVLETSEKQRQARINSNKSDRPLEFVCYGYMKKDNSIVIKKIKIPFLENLTTTNQKEIDKQLFFSQIPKDIRIESTSEAFDFLRNTKICNKDITELVVLFGYTRPVLEVDQLNIQNCMRMSELAKAVVPADVNFDNNIKTGVISIPPAIREQTSTPPYYVEKFAGVECAVINYDRDKNNHLSPSNIYNVTKSNLKISSSNQPLNGLPHPNKYM